MPGFINVPRRSNPFASLLPALIQQQLSEGLQERSEARQEKRLIAREKRQSKRQKEFLETPLSDLIKVGPKGNRFLMTLNGPKQITESQNKNFTNEIKNVAVENNISPELVTGKMLRKSRETKSRLKRQSDIKLTQAKEKIKNPTTAMAAFLKKNPNATNEEITNFAQGLKSKTSLVNIDQRTGSKIMQHLGEQQGRAFMAEHTEIQGAVRSLRTIQEAEKLLDQGIITGAGAKFLTKAASFLSSRLGVKKFDNPTQTTQAYGALVGNLVGQIIKQFGSGTGLSDADRLYAESIAGGNIEFNEGALRRLMSINKKANQVRIEQFNKKADQVHSKPGAENLLFDFHIEAPPEPINKTKKFTIIENK